MHSRLNARGVLLLSPAILKSLMLDDLLGTLRSEDSLLLPIEKIAPLFREVIVLFLFRIKAMPSHFTFIFCLKVNVIIIFHCPMYIFSIQRHIYLFFRSTEIV